MPKRRGVLARVLRSPGVISFVAVVGVVAVATVGFVVLTWLVFEDRYGLGFVDYVRHFLL